MSFGTSLVVAASARRIEGAARPDGGALSPRLRRGASVVSRLVADLVEDLGAHVDPKRARFVYGSAMGEIDTALTLMHMRHEHDGALSPARFAASVHSTPMSLLGIALASSRPSNTIAAGPSTLAMCLLDALLVQQETGELAVVVVADEAPPLTLGAKPAPPMGVALALASRASAPLGRLTLVRGPSEPDRVSDLPPAALGMALVEALRAGTSARTLVGTCHDAVWWADLEAVRGAE